MQYLNPHHVRQRTKFDAFQHTGWIRSNTNIQSFSQHQHLIGMANVVRSAVRHMKPQGHKRTDSKYLGEFFRKHGGFSADSTLANQARSRR